MPYNLKSIISIANGGNTNSKDSIEYDSIEGQPLLLHESDTADPLVNSRLQEVSAMIKRTNEYCNEFVTRASESYKQPVKRPGLRTILHMHTALSEKANESKKKASELLNEVAKSKSTSIKMEKLNKIYELMQSLYDDAQKGFNAINDLKVE